MTIVHPPSVEQNPDTIEALDWAPPCEYRRAPDCAAAEWIVWAIPICDCDYPPYRLFCGGCLERRLKLGSVYCPSCGLTGSVVGTIKRVEHI